MLDQLASGAPLIKGIVRTLSAPRVAVFNNATSLYTASIHVACATAFLEARAACAPGADQDAAEAAFNRAAALRSEAGELYTALAAFSQRGRLLLETRSARLRTLIGGVIGIEATPEDPLVLLPDACPRRPGALVPFEHASHMCMAALASGWALPDALAAWAPVALGSFSSSGKTFFPGPRTPQSPSRDWAATEVRHIRRVPGEPPLAIYISGGQVCAIVSSKSLRIGTSSQRKKVSILDLPAFIALPRDPAGRPIIPQSRVTALVEAQLAWHTELGTLDSLSSTITRGLLVMPKIATPSQRKVFRNHPSWEDDPAAQAALGPIIAKWLAQGVLEYVLWDDRQPVLLQPCGAVPKGSAPFYRLITDARFGNSLYSDWGVSYQSAADLSASVYYRDFTWSADLQDAYHLSVFAGCGGALRPCMRPVVQDDGTVSWVDGWVVGCTPDTCLGGCDKDMSGLSINGHVFRFAACQFGQKTAGSPLNALVMSVARYFARLPTPVHIAAWVDDLHFSMRTPPHPACAGHVGGCSICTTAYQQAVLMEEHWRQKARALNLPLSEGKGHTVAQGGPFTGVRLDTLQGRFFMLADKLVATRAVLAEACASTTTTPRILARCRGKAYHYGCAIPLIARLCPGLSQAIHQSESAFDLPAPSISEEEADQAFDWDQPLLVSARTRAILSLMLRTLDECGLQGQPMWPVPPAAIFGSFCDDDPSQVPPLVLLTAALDSGWGATCRTSPSGPVTTVGGTWSGTAALLGASWMAGFTPDPAGAPTSTEHRHALAVLLSLNALALTTSLQQRSILVRCPAPSAALALQRGVSSDPVLQDIVLLFTAACLDWHIGPPAFLLVQGPADPALATLPISTLTDTSTPQLRLLIRSLARSASQRISLDLFASSLNAFCPRFCSEFGEPAAELQDAFCQPSWASSLCPCCGVTRPEFVLLYPPFHLIAPAIRRAQADQAHGILVVPFATTASWWYTVSQASRTRLDRRTRALRLPCTPEYVLNQSNPLGHKIAVLHFDFWQGAEPRPRACLHGDFHRPHPTARSDSTDRLLITTLLASLA